MKLHVLYSLCVAAIGISATAQVPPENPIALTTEISEIATTSGKLAFVVAAILATNQVTTSIQVRNSGFTTPLIIDGKDVAAMMKLLEEASISLASGKAFAAKAGTLSVVLRGIDKQNWLVLKFESDRATESATQFVVDAYQARQIARALAQSKQVSDWFLANLPLLQSHMMILR